jgi:DNA polymerase III delta prime subunit
MTAHAYLFYGSDEGARSRFIEKKLGELAPQFTHVFGKEKPIGIDDSHEIRRRAHIAVPSGTQVFLIWRADEMTPEAAEALLKIIEEPPRGTYFFLLARSGVLPLTILSRVEKVAFFESGLPGKDTSASAEDTFFEEEIVNLRRELEETAREKGSVSPRVLHKLEAAVELSTMLRTTRSSPRYIIEAYKLTR